MSFGETIVSRRPAEAAAGQEEAEGVFTEGQVDRRALDLHHRTLPITSRLAQLSVVDSQGLLPLAASM